MQVLVISDNEPTSHGVQQVLFREGHDCPATNLVTLGAAVDRVTHGTPPDLAIVVLTPNTDQALGTVSELRTVSPVRLLVIGPASDPRLVLQSLRLGASDFLDEGQLETDLTAALARLQNELGPRAEPGQIIALLGPSGGSGSSTLAANVATVLAQKHAKALLVDMKLESGDLAALLDLHPTHSLADICQNMTRMDRAMFDRCLVPHSSGLKLLAPPANFRQVKDVTADGVRQSLTLARSLFPYVVLDLDHTFRDEQLQALKMADTILLVFRLDFASLRNANRTVEYLARLDIRPEKVRLVVNRYGQAQEVPVAKAEEALGMKVFHFVPEDAKSVNRANNNGVPVVLDYPSAKVAKSLSALAHSVNGRAPDHK
jgi:pilus assembly protein CpaE